MSKKHRFPLAFIFHVQKGVISAHVDSIALNISYITCGTMALPYAFIASRLHPVKGMVRSPTLKGSPSFRQRLPGLQSH